MSTCAKYVALIGWVTAWVVAGGAVGQETPASPASQTGADEWPDVPVVEATGGATPATPVTVAEPASSSARAVPPAAGAAPPAHVAAPAVAAPAAEPAQAEPVAAVDKPASPTPGFIGTPVSGFIRVPYRFRTNNQDSDNDLYGLLFLNAGDPQLHWVNAHFLGRAAFDLDGHVDNKGYYAFDSVTDYDGNRYDLRLYDANVDIHRVPHVETIRLGRQMLIDPPEIAYIDGAHIQTGDLGKLRFQLGGYGGRTVHFYEDYADAGWIAGVLAQLKPWAKGRLRVDWMYIDDDRVIESQQNDLLGLSLWQGLTDYFQLYGQLTWLEGIARDLTARATVFHPRANVMAQVAYYTLLETQRELAIEFDPFYSVLFDYYPFHELRAQASWGVGEYVNLEAGASWRRLKNELQVTENNHEFDRYYFTPGLHDVFARGTSLALTGSLWRAGDRDIKSIGGDVGYRRPHELTLGAGTYYSLYRYDYYAHRERTGVQTYYFKCDYYLWRSFAAGGAYELDLDGEQTIHTLRVVATWEF